MTLETSDPTGPCRDCDRDVSRSAWACPHCGAPSPADQDWDGWGYEYKSDAELLGLPLLHVSFKFRPNRVPVVARGWLAVGQFSCGFVNVSQFGVGPFCVSQFSLAGMALSQICAAPLAVCQIGLVYDGWGQILLRLKDWL